MKVSSMLNAKIRVMCVDDHRVVREGIASMIRRQRDLEIVASAATAEEAVKLFALHRPDVTLMDLQLPAMTGVEAILEIRREYPQARIIILTVHSGDEDIYRGLHAGAATYLLKDSLTSQLADVIRDVHAGVSAIPPDIARQLQERLTRTALSVREIAVVNLMAKGLRNKEIASELGISLETAKVHVKHSLAKLKVKDRVAAVTVALRRGIIHLR
jgi:DNA-binding NarL/FixJ family response regulator